MILVASVVRFSKIFEKVGILRKASKGGSLPEDLYRNRVLLRGSYRKFIREPPAVGEGPVFNAN
ncbi:hypothetical protein [Microbulbifer sp. TRSA007]|uniref:hypothetical protein n=1 Tax=Microbulbifer sp. TRSA007 TaxID=3243384 RepID=UPI00403A471A